MVGVATLFYLVNGPHLSKITNFEPILARSASAITPSEKSSINTNRKSTTRFPMSLTWSLYVAPKHALHLKKVCYKVSLCKNCQRQSCKAFISLTILANMIGGGRPLLRENLVDDDPPICKSQDEHRMSSLSPQRVVQKCNVSKIWTVSCDNSETIRDRMSVSINH